MQGIGAFAQSDIRHSGRSQVSFLHDLVLIGARCSARVQISARSVFCRRAGSTDDAKTGTLSGLLNITGVNMISSEQIQATHRLIAPHIRRTPVIEIDAADIDSSAARVILKLESLQHAGSFKARGAFASLLTRSVPPVGVVAASGGNHAHRRNAT